MSKQQIKRGDRIRNRSGHLVQPVIYVRPDGLPVVRDPNGRSKVIQRPEITSL
jgi:hypothetical protein